MKAITSALAGLFLLALAQAAPAQQVYTPERGSAERAAIMDAARVPVEAAIGKPVIFVVHHLRVSGIWAFANLEPRNPQGGPIDYRGTQYEDDVREGLFDNNVSVLLSRQGDGWVVVAYTIGATDVSWSSWPAEFKDAPRAIFPLPEE